MKVIYHHRELLVNVPHAQPMLSIAEHFWDRLQHRRALVSYNNYRFPPHRFHKCLKQPNIVFNVLL